MDSEIEIVGPTKGRRVQVAKVAKQRLKESGKTAFITNLADCCNVRMAADEAGVPRATLYYARLRDATFARQWDEALDIGYARLEAALLARALEGSGESEPPALPEGGERLETVKPEIGLKLLLERRKSASARELPMAANVADVTTRLARKLAVLGIRIERDGAGALDD